MGRIVQTAKTTVAWPGTALHTEQAVPRQGQWFEADGVLLLWLSQLILIPFDLRTVDSALDDTASAPQCVPSSQLTLVSQNHSLNIFLLLLPVLLMLLYYFTIVTSLFYYCYLYCNCYLWYSIANSFAARRTLAFEADRVVLLARIPRHHPV